MQTSKQSEIKSQVQGKKDSKGGNGTIVFLILSLLLNVGLTVAVIMLYNKSAGQQHKIAVLNGEVISRDTEVQLKITELEILEADLKRIEKEREKLNLSNDSLSIQIQNLGSTIYQLKKTNKLDDKKRKQLESLIATLREQVLLKDQQIAQLSVVNDSLSTNLSLLGEEKQKLGDSLVDVSNALAYASVLKAENMKVTALKENGKEFEGEELKGSKIDRLKITFSLADNKAAKKDKKTVYVALTTPKGTVFSDVNNGGGLVALADGAEVLYTLNQSINFNNKNEMLTFTMLKGFSYQPGNYKIDVYSEGYKIGEGKFAVK